MDVLVINPKIAIAMATMSVYGAGWDHRVDGPPDPPHASVAESLNVFTNLLWALQDQGVVPGTKLLIRIETVEE